jgi:hypothetical protein
MSKLLSSWDNIENDIEDVIGNLSQNAAENIIIKSEIKENKEESNFKEIENICNQSLQGSGNIDVDEILKIEPSELLIYDILKCQAALAYFSQSLYESDVENKSSTYHKLKDIQTYYQWITKSSEYLAKNINQTLSVIQNTKPNVLLRSSYSFCRNGYKCERFYNDHEITCREHHYVHNQVKHDADSLISFIGTVERELSDDDFNNIYMSIKTLCFVIRHMFKEFSYINAMTNGNPQKYYRNYNSSVGESLTDKEIKHKSPSQLTRNIKSDAKSTNIHNNNNNNKKNRKYKNNNDIKDIKDKPILNSNNPYSLLDE